MLFEHKQTGEIVEVVGYAYRSGKAAMAICLCDARLHFGRAPDAVEKGTVQVEYPSKILRPLKAPDWNEVGKLYPDGFEAFETKRRDEFVKDATRDAECVKKQEVALLRKDGIVGEEAELIASKKSDEYLAKRLRYVDKGSPKQERAAKW